MTSAAAQSGQGRRKTDALMVEVLREMREWFEQHEREDAVKFSALREEIQETRQETESRHKELVDRMEHMSQSTLSVIGEQNRALQEIHSMFKRSFPEGDADAHRMAHEHWMKKDEADAQFWLRLKQHVVNWAVVAVLGWGGIIIWAAFVRGPQ